jgi:tRNA A37 threonylcarbamoyladenosine dehydratase
LRLDCNSGFGTACFVTGTFGLVAAARVVQRIALHKTATSTTLSLRPEQVDSPP